MGQDSLANDIKRVFGNIETSTNTHYDTYRRGIIRGIMWGMCGGDPGNLNDLSLEQILALLPVEPPN